MHRHEGQSLLPLELPFIQFKLFVFLFSQLLGFLISDLHLIYKLLPDIVLDLSNEAMRSEDRLFVPVLDTATRRIVNHHLGLRRFGKSLAPLKVRVLSVV